TLRWIRGAAARYEEKRGAQRNERHVNIQDDGKGGIQLSHQTRGSSAASSCPSGLTGELSCEPGRRCPARTVMVRAWRRLGRREAADRPSSWAPERGLTL